MRWHDYIYGNTVNLRQEFPETIPFQLIEPRLIDLALEFQDDPDKAIITAYRRLEDIVRDRSRLTGESSAKLFSKAFQGDAPLLMWPGIETSEQQGRVSLFTGTYMAFRNRRAHREPEPDRSGALQEFLLINHLFKLEAEAVDPAAIETT